MLSMKNIVVFVLTAGKSTRMGTGKSKMIEIIEHNAQKKPMLVFTLDIFDKMGIDAFLLIGYDGTNVLKCVENQKNFKGHVRVCKDDGGDLVVNTGGTLKNFSKDILNAGKKYEHFIFCVGDQPFMKFETIRDFIIQHIKDKSDASILLADVKGTPLERSTSTRVSFIGSGTLLFQTPSKYDTNFESYSTLIDVGVIILTKEVFSLGVNSLSDNDVFGKIIYYLSEHGLSIKRFDAYDPYQFMNINEKADISLDIFP